MFVLLNEPDWIALEISSLILSGAMRMMFDGVVAGFCTTGAAVTGAGVVLAAVLSSAPSSSDAERVEGEPGSRLTPAK